MIDEVKLLEELEAWKAKCGDSPAEDAAKIMITAFIDKINAFPKVGITVKQEWTDAMMRHFIKVE